MIAVVGVGLDGTDTATIVALAVALDHLDRDEHVALIGLRPDPTTLHRQLDATSSLIAGLSHDHDVIILDVPPPPYPAGTEALTDADTILAVATPDELCRPDIAELTNAAANRVRLIVVATDPNAADHQTTTVGVGNVHTLTPPGPDLTGWIADPAFRRQCSAVTDAMNTVSRRSTSTA